MQRFFAVNLGGIMPKEELKHTNLNVKSRNNLSLDGVCNIIGFDENYVTLATAEGKIVIEGENLKIESLTRDAGEVCISGKILSVTYNDKLSIKSPFSKFFR